MQKKPTHQTFGRESIEGTTLHCVIGSAAVGFVNVVTKMKPYRNYAFVVSSPDGVMNARIARYACSPK
jgi:hypothetical protein